MKRLSFFLLSLLMLPLAVMAQGWDEAKYKAIEASIVAPSFPEKTFVITKYGAKPNGKAKANQIAINKAILACSKAGGGKVVVPAGTWNTGAIRMQSNVNLVVEKGATILFAFDPSL